MVSDGCDSASQYRDPDWLADELVRVLSFYYPTCVEATDRGFCAQLDGETGAVYDTEAKHLVATARFTANFARGVRLNGPDWCMPMAERGTDFLRDGHRDDTTGGYDWLLRGTEPVDQRRVCYGHAFVLLAYARVAAVGVDGADEYLQETADRIVERFWEPGPGLCCSEFDAAWDEAADYRGQNANMHTCEAMLAVYETTGDERYLDYARRIARGLCVELAEETDGLLWEHYTVDWEHDMAYNRDAPRDLFRPWGYQPGHHAEWAKLLAVLDRYTVTDWALGRAEELFEAAIDLGWDDEYGGFYYTVDLDGDPVVDDKYGWPVAEAVGAAAALHERTNEDRYLDWYDRLWEYADDALIAPERNWCLACSRTNEPRGTEPGPAVEPGYHPVGACVEAIRSFSGDGF